MTDNNNNNNNNNDNNKSMSFWSLQREKNKRRSL